MRPSDHNQQGVVAILALMAVCIFALALLGTMSELSTSGFASTNTTTATEKTYSAAETGINDALYRLLYDPGLTDYTMTTSDAAITVRLEHLGTQTNITSTATDPKSKTVRKLYVEVNTSSFSGGFDSAVQTGGGGIVMGQGSCIRGNVYANGSVAGDNNSIIDGDLTVATTDPSSPPSISDSLYIGDSTFNGSNCFKSNPKAGSKTVRSHALRCSGSKCPDIWGKAYYFDSSSVDTGVRVNNLACPNANCSAPNSDPVPRPLVINDDSFNLDWKKEITDTGTEVHESAPGVCPVSHANAYCIMSGTVTLGNQKLISSSGNPLDLYIAGNATLILKSPNPGTVRGNLWVTGNIMLDNSGGQKGSIQLDPSWGAGSGVLFADGRINVNNNYDVFGSGNSKSYLLLATTNNGMNVNSPDIDAGNGSQSLVYSAHRGLIVVENVGSVRASAAEKIYMKNNSLVVYDPSLASFYVPPQGGTQSIVPTLWKEL